MKVALMVPGGVDRTGTHRVIPTLIALIDRLAREHEVHVFALHQEARPSRFSLARATIHCVGAGRGASLRAVAAVRREHRRGRFALVHAYFGGVAPAGALAAALCRAPLMVHLVGGELTRLPEIGYGSGYGWRRRVLRAALRRAARVTVHGEPLAGQLRALGVRAEVLPYGADTGLWAPVPPRPRAAREARLLFAATLSRVKDPETLLRAAAILRDRGEAFRLEVVGGDTLGGAVQRLASELGMEAHVRFAGFLTQAELRARMLEADVLLVTSRQETGPVVALEAALSGLAVVGTPVGHLLEMAPGGAVLVPRADPAALAEAVTALLADEPRRLATARAGQAWARAHDADAAARRVLQLYQEMLLGR